MGYTKAKESIQEQMDKEIEESTKPYAAVAQAGRKLGEKIPISVGHFLLVTVHNNDIAKAEQFETEISKTDEKIAYAMIFGKNIEQVEKELNCERERIDEGAVNVLEMLARYNN